jgi:hypothetical protein
MPTGLATQWRPGPAKGGTLSRLTDARNVDTSSHRDHLVDLVRSATDGAFRGAPLRFGRSSATERVE